MQREIASDAIPAEVREDYEELLLGSVDAISLPLNQEQG